MRPGRKQDQARSLLGAKRPTTWSMLMAFNGTGPGSPVNIFRLTGQDPREAKEGKFEQDVFASKAIQNGNRGLGAAQEEIWIISTTLHHSSILAFGSANKMNMWQFG